MVDSPRLGEGFIRSHELLQELNDDLYKAYEILEENKESQYLRRCLVRAVFSYIEAIVETIKHELRSNIRTGFSTIDLTENEKKILGPTALFERDSNKVSFVDNVKKTFRLAAKVWELEDYVLNTDGLNFRDFRLAKHTRDRLTHPKTFYDIQITDDDMSYVSVAAEWLRYSFETLFKMRVASLNISVNEE